MPPNQHTANNRAEPAVPMVPWGTKDAMEHIGVNGKAGEVTPTEPSPSFPFSGFHSSHFSPVLLSLTPVKPQF